MMVQGETTRHDDDGHYCSTVEVRMGTSEAWWNAHDPLAVEGKVAVRSKVETPVALTILCD